MSTDVQPHPLATVAQDPVVDISHRVVDSPIGALLVAATPEGVVRIAFEGEGHDAVLGHLADAVGARLHDAPAATEGAVRQLDEYFSGHRRAFDVPVDLRLVRGFRRVVVEALASIPYGATRTYGEVARAAGNPAAVRAVGGACSHNPIPVILPCHRVVRSDGAIGQYLGGVGAKSALLALESPRGADLRHDGVRTGEAHRDGGAT